jgi:hypothetical protein
MLLNSGQSNGINHQHAPSECSTKANLQIKHHVLQRSQQHQHQAAAAKRAAMEVQHAWSSQQSQLQPPAKGGIQNLTAETLLVLNAEAEKGLLHLLAAGLVPQQLQLDPALAQGPNGEAPNSP